MAKPDKVGFCFFDDNFVVSFDKIVESKVADFYDPRITFLIEWYLDEFLNSSIHGYTEFPKWQIEAFKYIRLIHTNFQAKEAKNVMR